jgi:hypothetical protein
MRSCLSKCPSETLEFSSRLSASLTFNSIFLAPAEFLNEFSFSRIAIFKA